MATYEVAEIKQVEGAVVKERLGKVDPEALSAQLAEIRNALDPFVDSGGQASAFGLESLEIALTIGAEGKVWFVASGSVEASITMTFSRPDNV